MESNLNNVNYEGDSGLLARLGQICDHRNPRGVRDSLSAVLAVKRVPTNRWMSKSECNRRMGS